MSIIREYKLYKMKELENTDSEAESGVPDDENPDFDMSDLDDDMDNASTEDDPDFDMSDLDDIDDSSTEDDGLDDLDDGEMGLDNQDDLDMSDLDGGDDDEFSDETSDEDPDFDMSDLDDEEGDIDGDGEDSDFQGDIRNVSGACLIYKRVAEDSTYEELWVYNVGKDINTEVKIRRAILAGTDIKPQLGRSEDGQQTVKIWSMGNVQYLNIFGLPN